MRLWLFTAVSAAVSIGTSASVVSKPPQYFQTSPQLYAGPKVTGKPAFLAQTNPAPFPSVSYIPPQPVETQVPISGKPKEGENNIFRLHGQLSHYFPHPEGFGVDEYPLPTGAEVTQLHMLHRHGARYPTSTSYSAVEKLNNNKFNATGSLEFLNSWSYRLGAHILVPLGRQELFDSGIQHQIQYGHLYPNDGKIIVRSTTEDRMTKSAEYFLAGFFGQAWTRNATLELIIEKMGFNNSLVGAHQCPNNFEEPSRAGGKASAKWASTYLADARERLNKLIAFEDDDTELSIGDVHTFQTLCAYETVALGYSAFCGLFTYEEWEGFEYMTDIDFAGNFGFQSPTGRAVGIGWVQELRARLTHQYLRHDGGPANTTLDSNPETFPLDQSLYLDFSHDTNIWAVIVALGLTQFNTFLPPSGVTRGRSFVVSRVTPFAARLDIEVITAPRPVSPRRSHDRGAQDYALDDHAMPSGDKQTTYVHMLLNQRTIPLGSSYAQCGDRDDGWCELEKFLEATEDAYERSAFEFACFGEYPAVPYGEVTDGAPVQKAPKDFHPQPATKHDDGVSHDDDQKKPGSASSSIPDLLRSSTRWILVNYPLWLVVFLVFSCFSFFSMACL